MWPLESYNGTLHWEMGNLWHPQLFFANIQSSASQSNSYVAPAVIEHDGTVKIKMRIIGHFACDMRRSPFPFIVHTCSVDVGLLNGDDSLLYGVAPSLDAPPEEY